MSSKLKNSTVKKELDKRLSIEEVAKKFGLSVETIKKRKRVIAKAERRGEQIDKPRAKPTMNVKERIERAQMLTKPFDIKVNDEFENGSNTYIVTAIYDKHFICKKTCGKASYLESFLKTDYQVGLLKDELGNRKRRRKKHE